MKNNQYDFFKQTITQRGFIKLLFRDSYDKLCSLQESSNAEDDFIWLGIEDAEPLIMEKDAAKLGLISKDRPTAGWMKYPIPEEVLLHTRMHLSKEQAVTLGLKLLHFGTSGDISERNTQRLLMTVEENLQDTKEPQVTVCAELLQSQVKDPTRKSIQ